VNHPVQLALSPRSTSARWKAVVVQNATGAESSAGRSENITSAFEMHLRDCILFPRGEIF